MNPTARSAKWYYRDVEVCVDDFGRGTSLMGYTYPVGGRARMHKEIGKGVSLTESAGVGEGRDYHLELPPGVRGVVVTVAPADCRIQFATRAWQGPPVSREEEQDPRSALAVIRSPVRISACPTAVSELFIDGVLAYDAELCCWMHCALPDVWLSGDHTTWFPRGDRYSGDHTAVAIWPDGQVAEQSWTASAGRAVSVILSARGSPPEKHTVAESGGSPCLLRDHRGSYWLVWSGPEQAAEETPGPTPSVPRTSPAGRSDSTELYVSVSRDGRTWSCALATCERSDSTARSTPSSAWGRR